MAIDEKTGSSSKCRELNSENVVVATSTGLRSQKLNCKNVTASKAFNLIFFKDIRFF